MHKLSYIYIIEEDVKNIYLDTLNVCKPTQPPTLSQHLHTNAL